MLAPGPGTMKHLRAHLSLKEGSQPRFCRPRPVLFAIREAVGRELDRLHICGDCITPSLQVD